jgi:uncharacterized protein
MKAQSLPFLKSLLSLTLIGIASSSLAAGFDCTKAHSSVEKMICADSSISERDSTLNRLYLWKIDSAPQIEKPKIAADQKNWIANTRDACTTAECLGGAYDARVKAMSTIQFDGGTATYIADDSDIARISGEIQQNLRKVGVSQTLGTCSHVLSLDSHSNSYGAFCSLGSQKRVEVCYENLAGNLAVNFYGFSLTGSGLASFTQSVCPGG